MITQQSKPCELSPVVVMPLDEDISAQELPPYDHLVLYTHNLVKGGCNGVRFSARGCPKEELRQALYDTLQANLGYIRHQLTPKFHYSHPTHTLSIPTTEFFDHMRQASYPNTPQSGRSVATSQASSSTCSPSPSPAILPHGLRSPSPHAKAVFNHSVGGRDDIEITAKLFLLSVGDADHGSTVADSTLTEYVKDSLGRVLGHLGVDAIDHFLVSFRGFKITDTIADDNEASKSSGTPWPIPFHQVLTVWQALEAAHREARAKHLGLCEFNQAQLNDLVTHPAVSVPPESNQVAKLVSCCSQLQSLLTYCQSHHIDVQSNSDPSDILNAQDLEPILQDFGLDSEYSPPVPKWVLKYSVLLKHRGILVNKGYIVYTN
ncbi:hypothetical protein IWQ62_005141 [Dispira parvispora]|uniref:GCS light chain n=1 Tax=Dispira parvispora TaxID=1520584 RepID=A0A9W8AL09_9FUNG|nr:hypothetical protein IWQ62_005141 [Dispira parvispora]